MAKLTAAQELDAAIRNAAKAAESGVTSSEIAANFYAENRGLVSQVADQWIVEKLAVLIGRLRAKARREGNPQLVLEGMLGFTRLPARIQVAEGKVIRRADATIATFRKLIRNLKKQDNPAVAEIERAIEVMAKYTRKKRRITWGEVLELEAKKAGK